MTDREGRSHDAEVSALTRQVEALEAHLRDMDLPEATKQQMLAQARSALVGEAHKTLVDDVIAFLATYHHTHDLKALTGHELRLTLTFSDGGRIAELHETLVTPQHQARSRGRQKELETRAHRYIVNGEEYSSAAEAALDLKIEIMNKSANAVLQDAADAGQIEYMVIGSIVKD